MSRSMPTCRRLKHSWVDEVDTHVNPIGVKGIGEIGITGSAAAIANAVYHATGKRVRDFRSRSTNCCSC